MIKNLRLSQVFVLDQDEALAFYVDKLGLEVKVDADLGFMRWLTVGLPGDDREILLEVPGAPAHDEDTATSVRANVTKGAGGGWLAFTTDDVHATYADLQAKGVDLTSEPTEMSYGIDFGLRDPFGNPIRIGQMRTS